jgi:hypothetical protein
MSLSWTGITKNKILTDSDINRAAEDGFLTSKITIPSTDKGVTKERALQYININPLHVSYSEKLSNQLITKEDIKKPCDECTSYNIVINQSDLNDISGNTDNKIYLYYYPCGTYSGETSYLTFSYSGTFTDYICAQSCAVTEPYLYSSYIEGSTLTNSSYVEIAGNCALSTLRTTLACSGSLTYNVAAQGYNTPTQLFELNQTYGNVDITINISGNTNSNNEIFVGNRGLSYGTTYAFGAGVQSISDTVGFISNDTKTTLDVVVYSTTTGNTFTPFNVVFTASCPASDDPCSIVTTGTTYYSGTTINVTAIGNIKYDTINGFVFRNITSTGTYTINDCILINTLSPGYPLISVAAYNNVVTGSSCNSVTVDTSGSETSSTGTTVNCRTITFNANQEYSDTVSWIDCDGVFQTRFVERGTTFTTTALGNFYQIL